MLNQSPVRIIALDPGGTTGYAIGDLFSPSDKGQFNGCLITQGEAKLSVTGLWGLLESVSPTHVVAESFEYRQQQRDNVVLTSRNLLGVSELWSGLRDCDYSEQSPSEGKGFFTDSKLHKLGYFAPGRVHSRDACRHLLYYLAFKRGSRFLTASFRHTLVGKEWEGNIK